MSTAVLYCWCHSDGASVLLYFTNLFSLFKQYYRTWVDQLVIFLWLTTQNKQIDRTID